MSENQCVVDDNIDDQTHKADAKGDGNDLQTAEKGDENRGDDIEQVGELENREIFCTRCKDGGVRGKQAQKMTRQQGGQDEHEQAEYKSHLKGDAGQPADRGGLTLSPILGVEHHHGIANGDGDLLYQKLNLIDSGCTGKGSLTVAAQHNIICNVDRVSQNVLERNHKDQVKQVPIKAALLL